MDSKGLLLKLTLEELSTEGVSTDIQTFEGRKNVQKSLYLLQEENLPYGYYFGWYLRGPYSTGLTEDYFRVFENERDKYKNLAQGKTLADAIVKIIRHMVSQLASKDQRLPDQLEAAASARFIMKNESLDPESSVAELHRRKPGLRFDEDRVMRYLGSLAGMSR